MTNGFRRKNLRASIPETAFPEPYLLIETENTIIDGILELLNTYGLTSHQSMNHLHFQRHSIRVILRQRTEAFVSDPQVIYPA